jgi:hypothetical protein
MNRACGTNWGGEGCTQGVSGETCKRQRERFRRGWDNNISLDRTEIGSDIKVAIPLQAWTGPEGPGG